MARTDNIMYDILGQASRGSSEEPMSDVPQKILHLF